MALVKTSALAGKERSPSTMVVDKGVAPSPAPRAKARARAPETLSERLAAATQELASGVTEAAGAAEELRRAMEQIASGAEEAAGAAHESLAGAAALSAAFTQARMRADRSNAQAMELQTQLVEAGALIELSLEAIETNAAKQLRSVEATEALGRQAITIGEVSGAVADMADQTNLLALNAAIEAARAGDHGLGFAVVADEVRGLAEISETRSREVRELTGRIVDEVAAISARIGAAAATATSEAARARSASTALQAIREALGVIAEGGKSILSASIEIDSATREAQAAAESVASAAEEQAAAAAEAQRAVQQQSVSLDHSQKSAESLAALSDGLLTGDGGKVAEEAGAAAEELSATIQELAGAAGEILVAVDQINRGAQIQAATTQQTSAAMAQIQRAAAVAEAAAENSLGRIDDFGARLQESRDSILTLTAGVSSAAEETRATGELIGVLETSSHAIERIVEDMGLLAVQTTMLAVSGSVEAARAGDKGRGFAVVSSDIRNLARASGDNAARAREIVRQMQGQIANVRRDLEQLAAFGESEAQKSRKLNDRLAAVDEAAVELRAASQEIAEATAAARQTVEQILTGVEQVAAVAEEASSAAAQAGAAAQQQSRGAEDLAAAIEEIASLADELRAREA